MARRKQMTPVRKTRDPLFNPIKSEIVAARNKLRTRAAGPKGSTPAQKREIEKHFKKLAACHKRLGFGLLDNIFSR